MNTALKKLVRPHYLEMQGYVSAGMESGKDSSKIFMNANENPYELPGLEGFNRYPEPQPPAILEAYAQVYGVEPGHVVATRGADEAIVVLTKIFCEPHEDSILICPPTFGMYSVDAHAMPAEVIEVPLVKKDGTFFLDVKNIIAEGADAKLVFLCSPNNPTGTSFAHEDILKICKALEGRSVVILDETYAEFSQAGSLTSELNNHPNLIILRTLSKSYALTGLRMGCFLCADEDFVQLVRAKGLDAYPLPKASINGALRALSPEIFKIAQGNIRKILEERKRLQERLERSELVKHIYPSDANFLLIEMNRAKEFLEYCTARNVILRDFTNKPGTENCIRISVGTPEENDALFKLLNDFEQQA